MARRTPEEQALNDLYIARLKGFIAEKDELRQLLDTMGPQAWVDLIKPAYDVIVAKEKEVMDARDNYVRAWEHKQ